MKTIESRTFPTFQMLITLITFLTLITLRAQAQSGGVVISKNPDTTADPSAILDVQSNSQGVLIPRLTTEQRNQIQNPAIGLQIFNTDKGNIEYFNGIRWEALGTPIGSIQPFAGDTSQIPEGWLLCDGRLLEVDSNNVYYDLFQRIGENWGGDDSIFRVPDLRGLFLRGADLGSGRDPDADSRGALYSGGNTGSYIGSYQADNLKSHRHTGTTDAAGNHRHSFSYISATGQWGDNADDRYQARTYNRTGYTNYAGSHTHTFTTNYTGGNETRPKNVYVNYIIKY